MSARDSLLVVGKDDPTNDPRRYIAPLGKCCGRTFYTWQGWAEHLRTHREENREQ